MWNKFIAWVRLFFSNDCEFMPDAEWIAEHNRINEDHNILLGALKNEDEA